VVFSFWKATLDLSAAAISQVGITCARVDGSVASAKRAKIFEDFFNQKSQVLLISLSCGAVGYVIFKNRAILQCSSL
jgi:hypothetical protein